ncbi:MAG TPA: hypothetical protein VF074_19610 [Pyrinomonadaceae bacterium]
MSTSSQKLLASFDQLSDSEKRAFVTEILRRTFTRNGSPTIDETHLAALYAEFAAEDSDLAEQGMEDYAGGLQSEDGP